MEERKKHENDMEKQLLFQQKLYGNIEFVGELYRRKILPENILVSVFKSLLGFSEMNEEVDDLIVEAAINLMNKVGQNYEDNINVFTNDKKKNEKLHNFNEIIDRFGQL